MDAGNLPLTLNIYVFFCNLTFLSFFNNQVVPSFLLLCDPHEAVEAFTFLKPKRYL